MATSLSQQLCDAIEELKEDHARLIERQAAREPGAVSGGGHGGLDQSTVCDDWRASASLTDLVGHETA
jgi:hypothetical protein